MMNEEEYNLVLNRILEILAKYPVISIENLHNCKELETFKDDIIEMMVERLVDSGTVKYVSTNTRYLENSIQVLPNFTQRPSIEAADNSVTFSGFCLSLPPFDKYGLEDMLKPASRQFFNLAERFGALFSSANHSIEIISPFLDLKGLERFKPIVAVKVKEGVDLSILTREATSGTRFTSLISFFDVMEKPESKESISVDLRDYHYSRNGGKGVASSIHAKSIIIDEYLAYLGSGEIRENSFEKNLELGVLLEGPGVKGLSLLFKKMFQRSKVLYQW